MENALLGGYFGTAADGRIGTASGVGGQRDRRRVVLRGLKLHPAVPRRLVSLRVPRRCLRRVVAYRSCCYRPCMFLLYPP